MTSLAQSYTPAAGASTTQRQYFYPECRVVLSVVFENFGDPAAPVVFHVLPMSVSVCSNGYKEPDTWSVEFDAKDFPVTPELIRAGSVEIYMYQTRGLGQTPELVRAKDAPATGSLKGLAPTVVGLFDQANLQFSDSGRVASITGQDYTSLFIAKGWDVKKSGNGGRVPGGKTLDKVLQILIDQVDGAKAMSLKVETGDLPLPVIGKWDGKAHKKGRPVLAGKNYWDVMYELAIRYGFILFVRNLDIVLTTPRVYVEGRTQVKKMTWGRNLTSLRLSRKIGKEQVPIIEVRSYDSKARRTRKVRYPKNPKQKAVTGLGTIREEVRIHTVPGIRTDAHLLQVAETIYHLLGRAEQQVEFVTRDLVDVEGADMIELRNGDAIAIGLAPNSSDLLEGQNESQRKRTLVDLGYDQQVAATIAKGFDQLSVFAHPFRVREATFEWSADGGLEISVRCQSFVNISGEQP